MKTFIALIVLCLSVSLSFSQNCFWAFNAGDQGSDEGTYIACDQDSNVYVACWIEGPSLIINGDTVYDNSTDVQEILFMKLSIDGTVIWSNFTAGAIVIRDMITDTDGNVYFTGYIDGDSTVFGNTTLYNQGNGDAFLAKYDSSGNVVWANSIGGSDGYEEGNGIAVDEYGNVYVTGRYRSSTMTVGSDILIHEANTDYYDIFYARFDQAGNPVWGKSVGGNREDVANAIVTDQNGDIFISGEFRSDSITFGTTYLVTDAAGAWVYYFVKLNSNGEVLLEQHNNILWGSATVKDMDIDSAGNIYVVGEFSGVHFPFGGQEFLNNSSGSTDLFLLKYDNSGNELWINGGGNNSYDYSTALTVDDNNNIYVSGLFDDDSVTFGNHVIHNSTPLQPNNDFFIVKFDSSGNVISADGFGGDGSDQAHDIEAGIGSNVYFTGRFSSSTLTFGSAELTNLGEYDMYVADMYPFYSEIESFTDVSCYGADNGSITTFATEGNLPYSYMWSTNPVQTTPNATGLSAGINTVSITEGYGCTQVHSVTLSEPPAETAQICMVTTDSLSDYNVIVWDKTQNDATSEYVIYRETATDVYQPIAQIPYAENSIFIDTVRWLYFPNTGDPNEGTYRYKIQALDTCGGPGELSPYHNTIFILNSNGIFYWTAPYTIEGESNPVSSYVLMRDNNSDGNWQDVTSVAGTQQTISDPLYAIYENTASWRVRTVWSINCSTSKSFDYSLSNIYYGTLVGKEDLIDPSSIAIFPNPTMNQLKIRSNEEQIINIEITTLVGMQILQSDINSNRTIIDLSKLPSGIYFIKIHTDQNAYLQKIVKK